MEALKGKQVDAILVPQPFPGAAEARASARSSPGPATSIPWQIATDLLLEASSPPTARARVAFMKGYVKASRYYYDAALVQKDGRLAPGADYDEVVQITAKYTGRPARDHPARVSLPGPQRPAARRRTSSEQMAWWVEHGFMKRTLPLERSSTRRFLEDAVKQVGP